MCGKVRVPLDVSGSNEHLYYSPPRLDVPALQLVSMRDTVGRCADTVPVLRFLGAVQVTGVGPLARSWSSHCPSQPPCSRWDALSAASSANYQ